MFKNDLRSNQGSNNKLLKSQGRQNGGNMIKNFSG